MVGTTKWAPEWIYFSWELSNAGKKANEIAVDLRARWPRAGKEFNTGGVRYVLTNYRDPTGEALHRVISGGIEKMKKGSKASGSQTSPSPRMASAIHNHATIASAIPAGPTYDLQSQSYPSIPSMAGDPQTFEFYPGQKNMNQSSTSSAPKTMSSHPPPGKTSANFFPHSHAHPEHSFDGRKQSPYPSAGISGGKTDNPMFIDDDDDGDGVQHSGMQRTSFGQNNLAGYGPDNHNPRKMGNDGRAQRVQQQQQGGFQTRSTQMQPATHSDMNQFMNSQTQQVMGGFNTQNVGQVGLGQGMSSNANSGIMQNVSSQLYVPDDFQMSQQQQQQIFNDMLNETNSSAMQGFGGSNSRAPGLNHGHPNTQGNTSSGHFYTQNDRPSQEGTSSPSSQIKIGQHQQTGVFNLATSSHQVGQTRMSSGAANTRNPPYSKTATSSMNHGLVGDGMDLEISGDDLLDPQLLDRPADSPMHTASASRPNFLSKFKAPVPESGIKRKYQEHEPARNQLSGAAVQSSNADHPVSPNKRQKRDELKQVQTSSTEVQSSNAAVTGQSSMQDSAPIRGGSRNTPQKQNMQPSRDTAQRPTSSFRPQSQGQASQSHSTVSSNSEVINVFHILDQNPPNYDVKLLQQYKNAHEGRTPEQELTKTMSTGNMIGKDGQINEQGHVIAQLVNNIRREATELVRSPSATPQNSKQLHRIDQQSGTWVHGEPQSAMSVEEQRVQHKIMQEAISRGHYAGNPTGSILKQSRPLEHPSGQQNPSSSSVEKQQTSTHSPQHHASVNNNATGNPPTHHATPRMTGATPQVHQGGIQSKAPPTSQPKASDLSQTRGYGNDTGAVPHPQASSNAYRAVSTPQQAQYTGNGSGAVPHAQAPTTANRPVSTPQQAQYNCNGATGMQPQAGYLPPPNMNRSNTAPPSASIGLGSLQLLKDFNDQQGAAAVQTSTIHPPPHPRAGSSMGMMPGQMQPSPFQQTYSNQFFPAGNALMSGNMQHPPFQQALGNQQFSVGMPVNTPSTEQGYKSPYQRNGQVDPHSTPYQSARNIDCRPAPPQQKTYAQPMNQAARGATVAGPSTEQDHKVKTSKSGSNSSNSRTDTSSPETASPNTKAGSESPTEVPIPICQLENPIFHQHVTFPSRNDGWETFMDPLTGDYTLTAQGTIILMRNPQFLNGVSWAFEKEAPPPPTIIPNATQLGVTLPMASGNTHQAHVALVPAIVAASSPAPAIAPIPTTSGLTLPTPPQSHVKHVPAAITAPLPAPSTAPIPTTSGLTLPKPPQSHVKHVPAAITAPLPAPSTAPLPIKSGLTLPTPPQSHVKHVPAAITAPLPAPLPAPSTAPLPTTSSLTLPMPPGYIPKSIGTPAPASFTAPTKSSAPQSARQPSSTSKFVPSTSKAKDSKPKVPKLTVSPKVDQKFSTTNTNESMARVPERTESPSDHQQKSTTNDDFMQSSIHKPVASSKADQQKENPQVDSRDASSKPSVCDAGPSVEQVDDDDDDDDSLFGGGVDDFDEAFDDTNNLPGEAPEDDSSSSVHPGDQTPKPPTASTIPWPSPKIDQAKQVPRIDSQVASPKISAGNPHLHFQQMFEDAARDEDIDNPYRVFELETESSDDIFGGLGGSGFFGSGFS